MATYVEVTGTSENCSDKQPPKSASLNGNAAKTDRIPEGLLRRHEERLAKIEKQKEQRESAHVKQESADFFAKKFNGERSRIEGGLSSANTLARAELIDFFDELTDSAQKLQKYVTDMSQFLPSYDIRNAQENMTKLLNAINEKRDELLPKKKFAFKARKKGEGQTVQQTKKISVDDVDSAKSVNVITSSNACGFSNRASELLSLPADEMHMKDVSLSNLSSCTIKLPGSPSALHISNLSNCRVFCGPIPGSVFADKCVDSTLVLACQQLRVHNTKDTKFYLHVTSRAIIEDTTRVFYAPYNWLYDGLEQHYEESGLDRSKNAWDDVDDFNWLAHDKHSPNWGLIADEERVQNWE